MFAGRIKELRKETKMTQVQLAETLGVSKGTIAMWETGKRRPSFEMLDSLSELFDKRIDYILGYSDDSSSIRLNEKDIEQLGNWMIEEDAIEEFMDIMALDEYGRAAVHKLIKAEQKRCWKQGTLIPTDNLEIIVRFKK